MKVTIPPQLSKSNHAQEALALVQKCVHCGFCNAHCPTFRITSNELDSPRGRIYQIKSMFENNQTSSTVQQHLDSCLTCLKCQTVCPSSVEYRKLIDIARYWMDKRQPRSWKQRIIRNLLLFFIPYPKRFKPILRIAQHLKFLLPNSFKNHVPTLEKPLINLTELNKVLPSKTNLTISSIGTIILPTGCIQSITKANTHQAAKSLLQKMDYEVLTPNSGCCGALPHHLAQENQALTMFYKNINQWYDLLEQGAKHIVITASGCGITIKQYQYLIKDDLMLFKAQAVSKACVDLSEIISLGWLKNQLTSSKINQTDAKKNIVYHPPCTLQFGQQITNKVEILLETVGFNLLDFNHTDQCCGSAGSYSILQPKLAQILKKNKLKKITKVNPEIIATANIGCQLHLESDTNIPVVHWIELLNQKLVSHSTR